MQNFRRDKNNRINQGDIFKNITHIENWEESGNELKIFRIHYPYVVILSQDCDLREDDSARLEIINDKALVSVLAAPLYNFDQFLNGEHLKGLGIDAATPISKSPNKTNHKDFIKNLNPRYHFLEENPNGGLPKLVIDFKHYFSISIAYLQKVKDVNFERALDLLYRERLSQRFANYLSRIGLPDKKKTANQKCQAN